MTPNFMTRATRRIELPLTVMRMNMGEGREDRNQEFSLKCVRFEVSWISHPGDNVKLKK